MLTATRTTTMLPVEDPELTERAAWFTDTEGNILCLHEPSGNDA